jgi:phage gp16-like protein
MSDAERRAGLLARVHILKKQIGMSDDDYQNLLRKSFDVDSAGDLDLQRLPDLVKSLEAWGNINGTISKQDELILKLWQQLFEKGKTTNNSRDALNGWVKRQTGVERLEWLSTKQKAKVIDALKAWLKRVSK